MTRERKRPRSPAGAPPRPRATPRSPGAHARHWPRDKPVTPTWPAGRWKSHWTTRTRAPRRKKISYWGQSYGTYLGAVYRSLFQDHTDRMILEGNVDPTKVWANKVADTWGKGMADRFPDAARVAAAQDSTLNLGTNVAQVTHTYLILADRLDRTPAAIPGASVSLDGALLRNTTYALLLHNNTLPVLAKFWKAADDPAHGSTTGSGGECHGRVEEAGEQAPLRHSPGLGLRLKTQTQRCWMKWASVIGKTSPRTTGYSARSLVS